MKAIIRDKPKRRIKGKQPEKVKEAVPLHRAFQKAPEHVRKSPHMMQDLKAKLMEVPIGPNVKENYKRMNDVREAHLNEQRRKNVENEWAALNLGVLPLRAAPTLEQARAGQSGGMR